MKIYMKYTSIFMKNNGYALLAAYLNIVAGHLSIFTLSEQTKEIWKLQKL